MFSEDVPRRPPRPTCEDYDDDFEDVGEDTRTSANVAAKRSKPELYAKTDSGYASLASTAGSGSTNRREEKVTNLKIDTSFKERERQSYHYITPKTEALPPSNRPSSDSPVSKPTETKKYYKHRGECWVCDKYGKHIDPPKGTPVPVSPTMARRPPVAEDYVTTRTSQVQPSMRRTSSNRDSRPVSMHANTAPGVLWHPSMTPSMVQYIPLTPITYTQYPVTTTPPVVTPVETQGSYFGLPPSKPGPAEPNRRAAIYEQSERPVVQQGKSTPARSREEKDRPYNYPPPLHFHRSSQARDNDRRAMPPPPPSKPEQVLARRPSIKKSATSTPASTLRHHSQSYGIDHDEFPRLEIIRERKAEASLPPTSYRSPSAAFSDRPPNETSMSFDQSKYSIEVAARPTSAAEPLSRRLAEPSPVERYEAEAEAYRRRRGPPDLRSYHLIAEALRKVPQVRLLKARSETNSSQSSQNSSSKASSGAKTGQSNLDLAMRIDGIAVGIPADGDKRFTIQYKNAEEASVAISKRGIEGKHIRDGGQEAAQEILGDTPLQPADSSGDDSTSVAQCLNTAPTTQSGPLGILGSAVSLDDGSAEDEEDPKGSTPESSPATVNIISVQDDTSVHLPAVSDFDPIAGKIGTKRPVEYHVEVLDEMLSPAKRTGAEEVEEAESGSLCRYERQRRTMRYVLSWPFPFMYGALCRVVAIVLLPYLFGADGLIMALWATILIAISLEGVALPHRLMESLHHILMSPIIALRSYPLMAKGLWRPKLQAGHRRIEWVCDCGKILYSDFDNSNPGSIDELVNILTRPDRVAVHTAGPDPAQPSTAPINLSSQISTSRQSIGLESPNSISPRDQTDNLLAQTATSQCQSGVQHSFLELCVNTGKFQTTLYEISLIHVGSDGELFRKIKDGYTRLRGFRATRYFLIEPVAVQFVRFCVEERHRVGILEKPLALPSEEEVIGKRYQYQPCPLRPLPPIPSNVFVHYFNSSADHPRSVWMDRLPKKLQESIQNSREPLPIGWGIHIIEGPNRSAIFWMLVLFVCMSLFASCMWTVLKGDIQGGFGIGAWMVSVPSVMMLAFVFKWSDD